MPNPTRPIQPDDPGTSRPSPAPLPPRRRTVPIDDNGLRDLYKRVPVPTPPPEEGKSRQRRRYENDIDRVAPVTPRPAPGKGRTPPPVDAPVQPPKSGVRPVTPRPGTSPRYRAPQPAPTPTPPGRTLQPRRPGAGAPPPSGEVTPRGNREQAPWTWGRSDRRFAGKDPWGVNSAGNRIYGYWHRFHYHPAWLCYGYVPSWCNWGYYCWPAYYSWYYPRYYSSWCADWSWSSSYVFHWDSHDVRRHRFWYWPSRVYAPTYVYDYGSYGSGADYAEPSVYVTVRSEPTVIETILPSAPSKPSPATLAERHVELGDFYFTAGRYEDAAESYLRALAYVPDDASVHFALADALFALGDYHYAAFMVTKALDLDPGMATIVADKRKFYGDAKQFEAQMETLRRYLREKPYDAAAHLVLGYNLRMSDDQAGAKAAFERVLEIDKHNEAARAFLDAMAAPPAKDGERKD